MPAKHEKIVITQKNYDFLDSNQANNNNTFLERKSLSELEFKNTQQPTLPLLKPIKLQWNDSFGQLSFSERKKQLVQQNLVYFETQDTLEITAPQNAIISKIERANDGVYTCLLYTSPSPRDA